MLDTRVTSFPTKPTRARVVRVDGLYFGQSDRGKLYCSAVQGPRTTLRYLLGRYPEKMTKALKALGIVGQDVLDSAAEGQRKREARNTAKYLLSMASDFADLGRALTEEQKEHLSKIADGDLQ